MKGHEEEQSKENPTEMEQGSLDLSQLYPWIFSCGSLGIYKF